MGEGRREIFVERFSTAFSDVAGGYTSKSWASINGYQSDPEAFLFRLRGAHKSMPAKLARTSGSNEIYDHASNFPAFGSGHDLSLSGNTISCSVASFSGCPDGRALISGTCTHIEVYSVTSLMEHCQAQKSRETWSEKPLVDVEFTPE